MRTVCSAIVLFALWLLMSGVYKPMIIGFGVASVLIALFVVRRMDAVDGQPVQIKLRPIATLRYFLWLLVEIAKANWAVTKIIFAREMPIRQHLFWVDYSQKTDLGQVIYANSITLTPGTISVEVEDGKFLVHAVNYSASDPEALADMDARVSAIESRGL